MSGRNVLVVGGAGFIGSHTAKLLSRQGYKPVVYDNLSTGHLASVRWGTFVEGDILDTQRLIAVVEDHDPIAVIHFAASAYVGESVEHPAKYYRNNVSGTQSLLEACRLAGARNVIFSSSCATYGVPDQLPIREGEAQRPINPYGRTKLIAEQMLTDYSVAYDLRYVALRYFNASGADIDGEIGETHDPETHLIPRAMMAAAGASTFWKSTAMITIHRMAPASAITFMSPIWHARMCWQSNISSTAATIWLSIWVQDAAPLSRRFSMRSGA